MSQTLVSSQSSSLLSCLSPRHSTESAFPADLASRLLFSAESSFGDIDDKRVLDLGCGCCVLSIGAVMLGAAYVLGHSFTNPY